MDGTENQKRAVRSIIHTSQKPEGVDFVTWEDCANVIFREVDKNPKIRITFTPGHNDNWYWSDIGTVAETRPSNDPTTKLAGLPDEYPPSEEHRGNVLHEFGHVLGLEHEHKSPNLTSFVELNEQEVINHYGDERRARRQVLDRVRDPTNYTKFDKESIML